MKTSLDAFRAIHAAHLTAVRSLLEDDAWKEAEERAEALVRIERRLDELASWLGESE